MDHQTKTPKPSKIIRKKSTIKISKVIIPKVTKQAPTTTTIVLKRNEICLMSNKTNENNCFLNCVTQLLFHSTTFKNDLLRLPLQSKNASTNPLAQIKLLFELYETNLKSNKPSLLDVGKFRYAMSRNFTGYDQGNSGDPIEVVHHLLNCVHSLSLNGNVNEDNQKKCSPTCIAHKFFSLPLEEVTECLNCKKASRIKYDNNCFVYEVYTWEVFSSISNRTYQTFKKKLFNIYHEIVTSFDQTAKVPGCRCPRPTISKKIIQHESTAENLILNLVWDGAMPKMVDKWKLFNLIPLETPIGDLFDSVNPSIMYYLYGMILYWNGHYTCAVKSITKIENKWYFLDDYSQRIMMSFNELITYCITNEYHPIILFYSNNSTLYKNGKEANDILSAEEYNNLFNFCYNKDKIRNKKPISRLSTKSLQKTNEIIEKNSLKRSSFMRRSSINTTGSNICVYGNDDKWICPICNNENINNDIKCSKCGKGRLHLPSLKNTLEFVNELDNIKMVQSIYLENGQSQDKEVPLDEKIGENYICSISPTQTKDIKYDNNIITNKLLIKNGNDNHKIVLKRRKK